MGNVPTTCRNCKTMINKSDKNCTNCHEKNIYYIDYNLPIKSLDEYLQMKDGFLKDSFLNSKEKIALFNTRLNDDMHKKIFGKAHSYYITFIRHDAIIIGMPPRPVTLNDIKDILSKIYNRYYYVYIRELMPLGKVRIAQDPTGQNFENRMTLVMKDLDSRTLIDY